MDYRIREIKSNEYGILKEFLYEAIFVPEGEQAPPREIINQLNYAVKMYKNVGFEIVNESEEEYIMKCDLR